MTERKQSRTVFISNRVYILFTVMALLRSIFVQYSVIIISFCVTVVTFHATLVETRPFRSGSICRYHCQGEYTLCSTQASTPEVHMVCVLAKDLCRAQCKSRRYQRQPAYDKQLSKFIKTYLQKIRKSKTNDIVAVSTSKRPPTVTGI